MDDEPQNESDGLEEFGEPMTREEQAILGCLVGVAAIASLVFLLSWLEDFVAFMGRVLD